GPVLPAMANCHSHAFQRAMAGLAETGAASRDSFWTWRETMYSFALRLTPERLGAIAAQLYVEMLKAGYSTVAEFHYLHNTPDGAAYDDPAEMSRRVIDAARQAGIAITHLPVLYRHGGFGETPPDDRQRRFLKSRQELLDIIAELRRIYCDDPLVRIGLAPHSLRAVGAEDLNDIVSATKRHDPDAPVHIHIAEQRREVQECQDWSGRRPVEWLFENAPVDQSWCLIHATHMSETEIDAVAASGAVAGLCPTTEANLGDGLFPLGRFLATGGRFAIGSDSNVSVSVIEELRWLEYGQRLAAERRLVAASGEQPSAGSALYRAALAGGARATNQPVGALAPGYRADFLVLDPDHAALVARSGPSLLDGMIFAASSNPVRDVFVGGAQVIDNGHHRREDEIGDAFARALRSNEGGNNPAPKF
ncbi:MAG: formimidoylglutamate deiminase, partial [Sphingomonadales bacterium]